MGQCLKFQNLRFQNKKIGNKKSEKFYRLTVGRELKMMELKKRVKELEEKIVKKRKG